MTFPLVSEQQLSRKSPSGRSFVESLHVSLLPRFVGIASVREQNNSCEEEERLVQILRSPRGKGVVEMDWCLLLQEECRGGKGEVEG